MPSTHVIIVNYNAGDWLQRSVGSALKFTAGAVTVVDNASTDLSVTQTQAAFSDARLQWQLNNENVGFAAANNQVLKSTASDYVILMNPDCELNAATVPAVLAAFERHGNLGLASCQLLNEDGSLQKTSRRRLPTPWSALMRMLQLSRLFPNSRRFGDFDYGDTPSTNTEVESVEAVSGAFMVARTEALDTVGLLDEEYFMHCEDLDWCKRFTDDGWQIGFVPQVSVLHAKGISSRSRPVNVLWTLHTGMDRFFDKFYKTEYSLITRYAVKLGIYTSFALRALLSVLKRAGKK